MITVEEANGRAAKRRFVELPYLLFQEEPRWAPPLIGVEQARFDRFRNKRLLDIEHVHLLARDRGTPAGRAAVEIDDGVGHVTAYDADDRPGVAQALIDAVREWLAENDAHECEGPEVLVEGFDAPGATGRPWNPRWYAEGLEDAGLVATHERRTWRLPAVGAVTVQPTTTEPWPEVAGRYADPRLVLPGIAAVPDLTEARGSARELLRRTKRGTWTTAVVVRCDGDPSVLVPALQAAAGAAGYATVIAPWSPDRDAPPETVHARYVLSSAMSGSGGS